MRRPRLGTVVLAALALAALAQAPPCTSMPPSPGDFMLLDASGVVTARFYAAENYTELKETEVLSALAGCIPVVFHGPTAARLLGIAEPAIAPLNMEGATAVGVWRHGAGHVSVLVVRDANPAGADLEAAIRWTGEPPEAPSGAQAQVVTLVGVLTELDLHLPAGTLASRTEVLRVAEDSPDSDLYEFTAAQTLTPGAHTGESQWRWTRMEYSAGGGPGSSVELASYAPLPEDTQPRGLFTLLWRILTFRWGELFAWLTSGGGVTWTDASDQAAGLYTVAAEAPQGSDEAARPLEARHQFVVRVPEGAAPVVQRWTTATYRKGAAGVEAHTTPPMGGPMAVRPQPS